MTQRKIIINCAVTGAIHIPTQSPYLPISPQQIIDEAVKAANAGAGTIHVHVRNPENGQPTSDLGLFKQVLSEIQKKSDVVLCPTTGGGLGMTPEERLQVVAKLKPELASCNMGSFNYGLFPLLDRFETFKFDWERKYLEMTRDFIFSNTFHSLEVFMKTFKDSGTRPEMECYDVGHLYNIAYMAERGFIEKPFFLQFVMGILGGIQPSVDNLVHMKNTADRLFGKDYLWSVLAVGQYQFSYGMVAAVMGGNVRVGMEDNLYLSKGKLLKSNKESVLKIRRMIEDLSMEIALPDEVRQMLKLKGKDQTNFG
jgi:uncharacterized protein (DUF849 family)